jgi:hypothetical protein
MTGSVFLLLVSVFIALSECADVAVLGVTSAASVSAVQQLVASKHRVAAFDDDEQQSLRAMRLGAVSAFGESEAVQFAQRLVLVFGHEYFGRAIEVCEGTNKSVVLFIDDDRQQRLVLRDWAEEAQRKNVKIFLEPTNADAVDAVQRYSECAPQSVPADYTLYWRSWTSEEFACATKGLKICRLFARPSSTDLRLHLVAQHGEDPLMTSDPQGFFSVFSSATPQAIEAQLALANGNCSSFVTMGSSIAPSCVLPDPSFKVDQFLKEGKILKDSAWFCGDPTSRDTLVSEARRDVLIAQFVVRENESVSGQLKIIGGRPDRQMVESVQKFDCFCNAEKVKSEKKKKDEL